MLYMAEMMTAGYMHRFLGLLFKVIDERQESSCTDVEVLCQLHDLSEIANSKSASYLP